QVYHRAAVHDCLQQKLQQIRDAIDSRRARADVVKLTDGYDLRIMSFDTIAHDAASQGDVMDHMDADAVKTYTNAYAMMPYMERTNAREAESMAQMRSYARSGGPLTEDERARILSAVESLKTSDLGMWRAAGWSLPAIRSLGPLNSRRMMFFDRFARAKYG